VFDGHLKGLYVALSVFHFDKRMLTQAGVAFETKNIVSSIVESAGIEAMLGLEKLGRDLGEACYAEGSIKGLLSGWVR
jgi:hypothetical protein